MKGDSISNRSLIKWLSIEEWRFHTELFGSRRFLVFPLIILLFSAVIGGIAPLLSVETSTVLALYFGIITLFGVQTGVVGFNVQDALENVLGETSNLVFSSRTLPISQKRLAAMFLLKDAGYYSALFLIPILSGILVGLRVTPLDASSILSSLSVLSALLLYLLTVLVFAFGVSVGFMLTTIRFKRLSRLKNALLLAFGIVITLAIGVRLEGSVLTMTNANPIVLFGALVLGTIFSVSIGLYNFQGTSRSQSKTYKNLYRRTLGVRQGENVTTSLCLKYLIDIRRSAGGFWKLVFTSGTIALTGILFTIPLDELYTLYPRREFLIGGVLSLIAFPIYTVLFRYDSADTYLRLPITRGEFYKSKGFTYLILAMSLGTAYYLPIVLVRYSVDVFGVIQGLVVLLSLLVYQLGLLTVLVEDEPVEFLFDGVLFSVFSVLAMIVLVPTLVLGMFGLLLDTVVIYSVVGLCIVSGIVGLVLLAYRSDSLPSALRRTGE